MSNPNDFRPDNSVLALVDHQPFVAFSVKSIDMTTLVNATVGLAKTARTLEVPTVLTMISPPGSPLVDPILSDITDVFPEQTPIERTNTNAFADEAFVTALERTGRRKLVIAGLWTEVCVLQTVLSARTAGYEVLVVADACGGLTTEAHQDAKDRMLAAGAASQSWFGLLCEWSPDYSSPAYRALYPAVLAHSGGPSVASQYLMAQTPNNA